VFDLGAGFSDSIVEMQHLEGPKLGFGGRAVSVFRAVTTILALVSLLAICQTIVQEPRRWQENRPFRLAATSTLILLVLLATVPTLYGRYVWGLVVALLAAWVSGIQPPTVGRPPAITFILLVVFGAFGLLGLQDNRVCQQAIWQAAVDLEQQGIDPLQINAGLEYGGVRRFTPRYRGTQHQGPYLSALPPFERDSELTLYFPHNIFAPAREYAVAYGPVEGYEVIERRVFRSWLREGEILILRRRH
jgi:hypothetical protein